jgi:D-aminopeptidase
MTRMRLRQLGIAIGEMATGPHNAITDVPGVLVGHRTLIYDQPRIARTGVTVIVPRAGAIWQNHAFAGIHAFNGNGEMTGWAWLEESGLLTTPIAITNTHDVGVVRDALVRYGLESGQVQGFVLPVVAETFDGWLSDTDAFHVRAEHALEALDAARSGPVEEGNVGGGTGMRCHGFKGGIGTASRVIPSQSGTYTLGVLVQANYGAMRDLRVDGMPVGRELALEFGEGAGRGKGSIIVIVATDAPLLPVQCKRLAQRATVGLARAGGYGHNTSGDLFLAFAVGNDLPIQSSVPVALKMLPHDHLDPFFHGVADAVEEAILNALTAAETLQGFQGTAQALPLDRLQAIMARYAGIG